MTVEIRDATSADTEIIAEFNYRLAKETENRELDRAVLTSGVGRLLGDPSLGRYWIAEREGVIVGQTMITTEWSDWRDGLFWWIQSVYVIADARGTGVFRSLYKHVAQSARASEGCCGIRLYVEHDNEAAQATYRKLGMDFTDYKIMEELF